MLKLIYALTILFILALLAMGCSGSGSETLTTPANPDMAAVSVDTQAAANVPSNHTLWGIWQFNFDEPSNKLTVIPLREAYAHFNVTPMLLPPNCYDCVKIKNNSLDLVTRILNVDVTLRNPTAIPGHDVRGILYTNDYGHELRNADDWTGLYDITGGQTINPFKAFAKVQPNRLFAGGAEYTENCLVYIPVPAQWNKITYAVDASWPGNCKEPYSIDNFTQEKLYDIGDGQAMVTVDVHDWQNDVNKVTLVAPAITGESFTQLYKISGDTWGTYIKNNAVAPVGDYLTRVIATSAGLPDLALHDYFTLTISGSPSSKAWARTWGGGDWDEGYGVAVDGNGNVYTTGWFQGSADFDPGTGVDTHTSSLRDVFLSKYNLDGEFQWARTWGGVGEDSGYGITVDESNNVYVTGSYMGTVDFDPGIGTTSKTSNGSDDAFLSKFTSDGAFQWVRTWGAESPDCGRGVTADGIGDIYVTGYYQGTVDFNPSIVSDWHTSFGQTDIFLSKYDPSDTYKGARTWGGSQNDWGYGIAADTSGNAYITGFFNGTVDFDTGAPVDEHISKGGADIFLTKYDLSLKFQWARSWGDSDADLGYGVAVDASGNSFITGYFSGTVDFDPGLGTDEHTADTYQDVFLSMFDATGLFIGARTWGGSGSDEGRMVAIDGSGNAYVTGTFGSWVDFDPGPEVDMRGSVGQWDIFLSKFGTTGDYEWARTWGGSGDDRGNGAAVYGSSAIFVAGYFSDTADFDPGDGVDEHISNGIRDIFLSKFPPDGNW